MHKLTKIDKIIISELLDNSRISIKKLSKKHRISRTAILNRMKILEEKDILGGYNVDFNPSFAGVFQFNILIKTKKIPRLTKIREITKKIPNIYRVLLCAGPFNIQIKLLLSGLNDIEKIMDCLNTKLEIEKFEYLIDLEKTFFLKDFFDIGLKINKTYGPFKYEKVKQICNKTELKILKMLTKNCRLSLTEIANRINKPVSTVNFSFRKLKKQKIIEKFGLFLRSERFGYCVYNIKIKINNLNKITSKKIINFCKEFNGFVCTRTSGKWNYDLKFFVKKEKEYKIYSIAKKIQESFKNLEKLDIFKPYSGYSRQMDIEKITC